MIRSHCCSYNTLSSNNIIISLRRRSRGRIHHNLNQFQRFISTESHGSSISSSLPSASPSTSITDQEPYHDTTNKTARDRLLFSNSSSSSNSLSNTTSNVDVILSSNPIESGSSTTTTTETATTTATGLPLPRHMTRQGREIIPFNTHKFIQAVEQGSGFHTSLAEGIMRATATLLSNRQERVEREVTSRQDLENSAYLFSAALSELKTSSSLKTYNDTITLRSLTSTLNRETESLTIKLREEMSGLKAEIQLEMNARKEESGEDLKGLDMKVMELNNKFTILLGEVRTEIEATKWISTRRVMSAIVIVVVSVVAFVSAPAGGYMPTKDSTSDPSESSRFDDDGSSHAYVPGSASNSRPTSTFLRSLEEMGISEEADMQPVQTDHYRV